MAKSTVKAMEMEDLMDLSEFDEELESTDDFEFDDFEEEEEVPAKVTFSKKLPTKQRQVKKPVVELDEEEDFEEEIIEEKPVKPAPKTKAKEIKVPVEKPVVEKQVKKSKPSGKTRSRVTTPSNASYEDLFGKVTEKVDKYNTIMEARNAGKSKEIPQSVVVSKELLVALLSSKFSESNDTGIKAAMTKAMVSMGFDKEDVVDAVSGYSFKKVESEMIFNAVLDVLYDILNAGAGVPLWKNEDCNCTLKGEWTEPKLYTNEHLKTDKATYTESFLKVTTNSPAPMNKKSTGVIKKGKFIPDEEE